MANDRNRAIDAEGNRLPFTSDEVQSVIRQAMADGELLACVVLMPDGSVAVPCLCGPEQGTQVADALMQAATAIRHAVSH